MFLSLFFLLQNSNDNLKEKVEKHVFFVVIVISMKLQ